MCLPGVVALMGVVGDGSGPPLEGTVVEAGVPR